VKIKKIAVCFNLKSCASIDRRERCCNFQCGRFVSVSRGYWIKEATARPLCYCSSRHNLYGKKRSSHWLLHLWAERLNQVYRRVQFYH